MANAKVQNIFNNDETPKKLKNVDDVLQVIKPFGKYQIIVLLIYSYTCFPLCVNYFFMAYGGMDPKWVCTDPSLNTSMQPTDNCEIYKKCPPDNLTFVSSFYSIGMEWKLVCDQKYFVSLTTSMQMIGQLIGCLGIGPLSDLYGRKWLYIIGMFFEMLTGGLAAVSTSATMFLVFRFVMGLCTGASGVIAWIFCAEVTTNRYRLIIRMLACVILPYWNNLLMAYVTQDWRWYSIVGNAEGLPTLILLAIFTYESPRWMVQKGHIKKATHILNEIAAVNKTKHLLDEHTMELESDAKKNTSGKRYYVWDLFRTKQMALITVICAFNWFSANIAFYGMFLNIGNLSSNIYMNVAFLAALLMLELPIAAFDTFSKKANRKHMMVTFFIVAAICDILIALFQTVISGKASGILIVLCSSIGQVATGCAMDLCYIYAVELFPTLIRSNAQGLMSVAARIGGVIAPQLLYAGKFWTPLPYVCFAAISLLAAVADLLFLPDTRKMTLPESFQHGNIEQKAVTFEKEMDCDSSGTRTRSNSGT